MSARRRCWQVVGLLVGLAGAPGPAEGQAAKPPVTRWDPPEAKEMAKEAKRLSDAGRYDEALLFHERILALRERVLGAQAWDVGTTLNDMAVIHLRKGDYARAEPLFQRALAIHEKDKVSSEIAATLHNLATLYFLEGDYARAERHNLRALSLREKLYGEDHPAVALSLANLAVTYATRGDYARAEPLLARVLTIREKALGPDHPDVAGVLQDIATTAVERGDYARAAPLFERTLAIYEKAFGKDHPELGHPLHNLAELYVLSGDYGRAQPLHERALAIRERVLGEGHPDVAASLGSLAAMHLAAGHVERALPLEERAVDIRTKNLALALETGTEAQKLAYVRKYGAYLDRAISTHARSAPTHPVARRLALTAVLRHKGIILDAVTDGHAALRRHLTPEDQASLDRLASVESQLGARINRGPGSLSRADFQSAVDGLEADRQRLEAKLAARSATFRAARQPVTIAQVQAALPEGAALLELVRYKPYEPAATKVQGRQAAPARYAAYVLHRAGEPAYADLGPAAPIEAAMKALRGALAGDAVQRDPRPAARDAHARILAPVSALLGDARRVFVSPDAVLNLIPFGALIDESGHYLLERWSFSYLTSGRDLLRRADRPAPRQEPLLLAAPDFGARSSGPPPADGKRGRRARDLGDHLPVAPLPGTLKEAQAIAARLPGARVLLGAEATEGAVKAAHAPAILHLATHGFFFEHRRGAENALLRSGLLLAGANALTSGDDDGVLTALEASELDLYGTKLVVLSACETGLGAASTGEGVYGLRRAFSTAGAATTVMSLWDADDEATRALMTAFYERLKKGAGRSEAMREAQLALLARPETAHPSLWAAFIVSGDDDPLAFQVFQEGDVPKAAPSARGCACALPPAGGEVPASAAALGLFALLVTRGRSTRRRAAACRRPGPRPRPASDRWGR